MISDHEEHLSILSAREHSGSFSQSTLKEFSARVHSGSISRYWKIYFVNSREVQTKSCQMKICSFFLQCNAKLAFKKICG